MKVNFILLLVFLTATTSMYAQVDLKGIELGSTMSEDGKIMSLIGKDYYIFTHNISDGKCSSVFAIPADGNDIRRISYTELTQLITAVETKYGVELKFTPASSSNKDEGWYVAKKDGVRYVLSVTDYNQFLDYPYEITLDLSNLELDKIYEQEQQEIANQDI